LASLTPQHAAQVRLLLVLLLVLTVFAAAAYAEMLAF
jgi:hypothetical protein